MSAGPNEPRNDRRRAAEIEGAGKAELKRAAQEELGRMHAARLRGYCKHQQDVIGGPHAPARRAELEARRDARLRELEAIVSPAPATTSGVQASRRKLVQTEGHCGKPIGAVVERMSVDNGGQALASLKQCESIAQKFADYVAGEPVDLADVPSDTAKFLELREHQSFEQRRKSVSGLARRIGLTPSALSKVDNADLAFLQTLESAVHAAIVTYRVRHGSLAQIARVMEIVNAPTGAPKPERGATWGVR